MAIPNEANASHSREAAPSARFESAHSGAGGALKGLWIVQWTCGVGAILLAFVGFWRNRVLYLKLVDNSDLLFYADLYSALVHGQYSMKGWDPPSVPFFFPDMPALYASFLLTPNLASGYCLFAGIIIAAMLGSLYWVAGEYSPGRGARILAVGIVAMGMFVLSCAKDSTYWDIFRWVIAPNAHGGGAVTGIVLIGFGMRLLERPSRNGFILFWLLCSLAISSDFIVLPHYLVPLLIGGVFQWIMRRTRIWRVLLMAAIVAGVSLTAAPLVKWIAGRVGVGAHPFTSYAASGQEFAENWNRFRHDLPLIVGPTTALFVLLAGSVVATAGAIAISRRSLEGSRLQVLAVVALLSWSAALVLPIRYPVWGNSDCSRYLLPLVVLPLMLLVIAALMLLRRIRLWAWTTAAVAGLVCTLGAGRAVFKGSPVNNATIFYTPEIRFLDSVAEKYHLHAGYGNYWQTRPMSMFSRTHVVVNEVKVCEGEIMPSYWMNNPNRWARKPKRDWAGEEVHYPIYDFCVLGAEEYKFLNAHCGPPAAIEQEGGFRVFIYNRPEDVVFRNLCRARAERAARMAPLRKISPKLLSWPRSGTTRWNIIGTSELAPGADLVVQMEETASADFMDISTHQPNTYDITFEQGHEIVGTFRLDPIAAPGLRARAVSLLPILHGKPFDSIRIRAVGVGEHPTVAHLFVFDDVIAHKEKGK